MLFIGELVVVNKILEADDTRVEDAAFAEAVELFPLCKRFDNVPLDATGFRVPVYRQQSIIINIS